MRKFVVNITLISFIFCGFIAYKFHTVNSKIYNGDYFKKKKKPTMLIVGDSHPECALIDSLNPYLYNIAHSSESFIFSYIKAKKIIEENRSITTLFIEFSPLNLSETRENAIWGDKLGWRFPCFAPFMNKEELFFFVRHNPTIVFSKISNSIKENEEFLKSGSKDYFGDKGLGGYRYLSYSAIKWIQKKKKKIIFKIKNIDGDLYYLDKLLHLCKMKNIKPVFIRCPIHPSYGIWQIEKPFQKIVKSRYRKIDFFDFSKFKLKDEDFFDLHHLNNRGAKKFTRYFNDLINSGILKNKKTQHFIYSE